MVGNPMLDFLPEIPSKIGKVPCPLLHWGRPSGRSGERRDSEHGEPDVSIKFLARTLQAAAQPLYRNAWWTSQPQCS